MYINSYKYIISDNSELQNLANNSFDQIQAIENIKNYLKKSAEEFEAKQLLKKTKFIASTDLSNITYATELTNDISYIEQVKNSSSNTNEVSEIIDKEIEFLNAQKSSVKDDEFQKIIKELFSNELINKKFIIERSAEEFEVKQLLKKTKFLASTDLSNITYATELTSDISYIEQVKNSSNNTNEVSEIIEKKIEFLQTQESSIKNDQFQKIIEELFPDELNNKELIVESQLLEPFVLSSNVNQVTSLQSPPSTDIVGLAWSIGVLSFDNNLEYEAKESAISSDLTNDVSSSHPTPKINQKIPEQPIKRSWKNPEYRKMRLEAIKRSWEAEEYRKKKHCEDMKRYWEDPEHKKKQSETMKGIWKNPEYMNKHSEYMKRKWEDPEYRKKQAEARKKKAEDPEYRKKYSERMKRNWEDPEYRKKQAEARKKKAEDPHYRKKILKLAKANNQKTIEKMMEAFTTETFVVKKPTKTYQKLRNSSLSHTVL